MKLVIQAMVFGLFFAIQSNMQAAQAPEQAPAPSVTIQFIDRNGRVQKERTVLPGLFENLKKASAVIGDLAGSFGQITKIPLPIENVDPSTFILILSLIQSSNIGSMLEKIKPDQIIRLMRA
ncbi:MAG: hypothetical protein M1114_01085, partial [Candidatus Dependentiae bacterium]|nr:hypothetical protein [Candidatus Dependentiae bacterium]